MDKLFPEYSDIHTGSGKITVVVKCEINASLCIELVGNGFSKIVTGTELRAVLPSQTNHVRMFRVGISSSELIPETENFQVRITFLLSGKPVYDQLHQVTSSSTTPINFFFKLKKNINPENPLLYLY